jgi:hypothetical protein
MKGKREPYGENPPGPFYVEKDLCLICGTPESEAPDLIGFQEDPSGTKGKIIAFSRSSPKHLRNWTERPQRCGWPAAEPTATGATTLPSSAASSTRVSTRARSTTYEIDSGGPIASPIAPPVPPGAPHRDARSSRHRIDLSRFGHAPGACGRAQFCKPVHRWVGGRLITHIPPIRR